MGHCAAPDIALREYQAVNSKPLRAQLRRMWLAIFSAFQLLPSFILAFQTPFRLEHSSGSDHQLAAHANLNGFANVSTGNFIFNDLASLLQQLPNSIRPSGHVICPTIIRVHTPLYHARTGSVAPPSPEWLAFEPEMSYAISEQDVRCRAACWSADAAFYA